jgi:hypothetical protein
MTAACMLGRAVLTVSAAGGSATATGPVMPVGAAAPSCLAGETMGGRGVRTGTVEAAGAVAGMGVGAACAASTAVIHPQDT